MQHGTQRICIGCGSKLLTVSNPRGVRYWEKKLELSGRKLMDGFTKVDENLIRINHQSLVTAEIWGKEFPLEEKHVRASCPECMEKFLRKKGIR